MEDPIFWKMVSAMFLALASINAYFIKALIAKIDHADKNLTKNEEQIRQLKEQIAEFSVFLKDISDLKSQVAVLKYAVNKCALHGSDEIE